MGAIQPGTFSPLTVSLRALASTFSTLPRRMCSFFTIGCAAAGFEDAVEFDVEGAGRPSHPKPNVAENTSKAATVGIISPIIPPQMAYNDATVIREKESIMRWASSLLVLSLFLISSPAHGATVI